MKMIPHPIPYQGSKRSIAPHISSFFPKSIETFFEPFVGSAAMSLYAAKHDLARFFVLGDNCSELIELWKNIIYFPEVTASRYEVIWNGQIESGSKDYFNVVRHQFNIDRDPIKLLYLIVRCVKNAVRFNQHGYFTQSVDKRRLGTQPKKMEKAIQEASYLLKGKVKLYCADFIETLKSAGKSDLIYLDPPYQGTTYGRDKRYFKQLSKEILINALSDLNNKKIAFILSYDGMTGDNVYGIPLPQNLYMKRLLINTGISAQSVLNGSKKITIESLYISKYLENNINLDFLLKDNQQLNLFAAL